MSDPEPEKDLNPESQCDCSDCAESSEEEELSGESRGDSGQSSPRSGEASGGSESEANSEYTPGSSRASSGASSREASPQREGSQSTNAATKSKSPRGAGGQAQNGSRHARSVEGEEFSAETKALLEEAAKLLERHSGGGDRERVDNPEPSTEELDLNESMDSLPGTGLDQDHDLKVDLQSQDEEGSPVRKKSKPGTDFEVEQILSKRIYKYKIQYWIKWKGHPDSANSWEPEENLTNCPELLAAFNKKWMEEKQNRKKGPGRGYTKAILGIGRKRAKNPDSDSDDEEESQDKTAAVPKPGSVPTPRLNPEPEPDPEDLL